MTKIKTSFYLKQCFESLRNDKNHHLGMGDIRLTIGQQDEIADMFDKYTASTQRSEFWKETSRLIDLYREEGNERAAQAIVDCRLLFARIFG